MMVIAALVTPRDPLVADYIDGMHAWRPEFEALRPILVRAGLDEDFKWRKPCYTHAGSNVVIFQPFKEQGENTRSALRLEFRSVADVGDRGGAPLLVATGDHDLLGPVGDEQPCRLGPDPCGASGDQCALSLESHLFLPVVFQCLVRD
jgi:hypothetical protein